MKEYPKRVYSKLTGELKSKRIESQSEEADGWFDHPNKCEIKKVVEKEAPTKKAVKKKATKKKV